jgi:hypothetical protein
MGAFSWRRILAATLFSLVLLPAVGCGNRQPEAAAPPPAPAPDYIPTATVKDLMDGFIDPSADVVWNAVATVVDAKGVHDQIPKTDEEWAQARLGALKVIEGANLLMMPGRKVARPHEKSEVPGVELEPEVIETNINNDRATWVKLAKSLHDATMEALRGIDAKDGPAVIVAGERMDQACEACHAHYWYPNQPLPPGYVGRD